MLKSFFAFLLLVCLTSVGYSTVVNVGVESRPYFGALDLGTSDKALTGVSVTNSSTSVTCSACFPSAAVTYAGFTINLNGTDYAVAVVNSASSLTLATAYSGPTATVTGTFWKWVWLGVWADKDYRPFGATYIITGSSVGSNSWYKKVGASITASAGTNYLRLPALALDATLDAVPNTAKLYFWLYRVSGQGFGAAISALACTQNGWQITTATPTSYIDLCARNSPPTSPPPDNQTYSRNEVDATRPNCLLNNGVYYAANGKQQSCLTFGTGLTIAGGTLSASGGNPPYRTITGLSALSASDGVIYCDATAGNVTLQGLPAASANQQIFYFKKIDTSANTCTFDPNGAETIDGAATFTLSNQYAEIDFQSISTAWRITGSYNLISSQTAVRTVTSSGNILTTDGTILCDATAGAIVLTLPSSVSVSGQRFTIVKTDTGPNTCTVQRAGSDVINPAYTSFVILSPNQPQTIQSNGTTVWYPVAY